MQQLYINNFSEIAMQLEKISDTIAIITDETVTELYGKKLAHELHEAGLTPLLLTIPSGETSKTRQIKEGIEDSLLEARFGRNLLIVGMGGGVVTDLSGFVAATYMRGVKLAFIPTTLMAMCDAAIGGKNGVNTREGKNLIGSFYPPSHLLIHLPFLESLPDDQLRSGFAEVIKYGCILDEPFFDLLKKSPKPNEEIVKRSIAHKLSVVEKDGMEMGYRRILNFGHTIAHAIERACNYSIPHGDAVGIGMLAEARISSKMGYLPDDDYEAIKSLLTLYGFTLGLSDLDPKLLQRALRIDKKSEHQTPRFVLIDRIGHTLDFDGQYCTQVPDNLIEATIQELIHGRL